MVRTVYYGLWLLPLYWALTNASVGDRLPEFKECVETCTRANCEAGDSVLRKIPSPLARLSPQWANLALHLRLLLWTCPSNCDYTCQHIVTNERKDREPPVPNPVLQYHGKWPFYRFLGVQEPFSVIFSFLNFAAHRQGLAKIQDRVPKTFSLRPFYHWLSYIGMASWFFSMVFHTRDFNLTEKLDYFAAGASVMYGLYYTPVRIFRLEQRRSPVQYTLLRTWTMTCIILYLAHVSYLTFWSWDYAYNMAANVAAGVVQNVLWSWFSITSYQKLKKPWAAWPGLIVAWIVLAMSLELLDFPPVGGMVDAHSLWHLGTVGPTIWWYNFLVKDAQQELAGERLKA